MTTWAYFLENTSTTLWIDNRPIFEVIRDLGISEDAVFVDDVAGDATELDALMGVVQRGDVVLIRSLVDLAGWGSLADMVGMLQAFEDQGVDVVSVSEPWYQYKVNFALVARMVDLGVEVAERRRRVGMERAKREGRMGRKASAGKAEQIRRLRSAGFSVKETCDLCGISRTTYYRRMGQQEKYAPK